MHRDRTSRITALWLSGIMGLAVLVPEAGHSHAHRQEVARTWYQVRDHGAAQQVLGSVLSRTQVGEDHPHADLRARLPGKSLLQHAAAAQVTRLFSDLADSLRCTPAFPAGIALVLSEHGPPPPARAPPRT
jgi:hypothetical protein